MTLSFEAFTNEVDTFIDVSRERYKDYAYSSGALGSLLKQAFLGLPPESKNQVFSTLRYLIECNQKEAA